MEDLVRQQRQHGAFLAEGAADEGIDGDQEYELGQVLTQAQGDAGALWAFPPDCAALR